MFGGSGFLLASVFRAGLRWSRPFLLLPLFTQVVVGMFTEVRIQSHVHLAPIARIPTVGTPT